MTEAASKFKVGDTVRLKGQTVPMTVVGGKFGDLPTADGLTVVYFDSAGWLRKHTFFKDDALEFLPRQVAGWSEPRDQEGSYAG